MRTFLFRPICILPPGSHYTRHTHTQHTHASTNAVAQTVLRSTPLAHKAGAARMSPLATAGNRLSAAKGMLTERAPALAAVAGVQGLRAGIYGLVEYKNAQKPNSGAARDPRGTARRTK